MYNRLDRKKNPPDIKYNCKQIPGAAINLFDMADDSMKQSYLITDEEFDKLLDVFETDREKYFPIEATFVNGGRNYSSRKQLLLAIKSIL